MRRRTFIAGLGSVAAWPMVAWAQDKPLPVIGWLSAQSADDDYKNFTVPFLQGLKEAGYVEGQNVAVEYRYAEKRWQRRTAGRVAAGVNPRFFGGTSLAACCQAWVMNKGPSPAPCS